MRFLSNRPNPRYVMRAATWRMNAIGIREPMRGISAQFNRHSFDSLKAQKELHWTDQEREALENYLKAHGDFDPDYEPHDTVAVRIFLDPSVHPEARPQVSTDAEPAATAFRRCMMDDGDGGMCGKRVAADDSRSKETSEDYCPRHAKEVAEQLQEASA